MRQSPSSEALAIGVVMPPPAPDAPPLPDCAFSMVWADTEGDAQNLDWLRQTSGALDAATIGHYVGEADLEAGESRARRSFSDASWQRLVELRRQ